MFLGETTLQNIVGERDKLAYISLGIGIAAASRTHFSFPLFFSDTLLARGLSLALARTSISGTVEAINHCLVNVILLHQIAEAHDGARLL